MSQLVLPQRPPTRRAPRALVAVLGMLALAVGSFTALSPASAADRAGAGVAWVRAAHLVPGIGSTRVNLDPAGGTARATPVVMSPGAAYGDVTDYQKVAPGTYTVTVTPTSGGSGAPMLSRRFTITKGQAMTLAVIGTEAAPRLATLRDDLTPPSAGDVNVRVLPAVSKADALSVQAVNGPVVASDAVLGQATGYRSVPAGSWTLKVSADAMAAATAKVKAEGRRRLHGRRARRLGRGPAHQGGHGRRGHGRRGAEGWRADRWRRHRAVARPRAAPGARAAARRHRARRARGAAPAPPGAGHRASVTTRRRPARQGRSAALVGVLLGAIALTGCGGRRLIPRPPPPRRRPPSPAPRAPPPERARTPPRTPGRTPHPRCPRRPARSSRLREAPGRCGCSCPASASTRASSTWASRRTARSRCRPTTTGPGGWRPAPCRVPAGPP
nr:DUF4397 domain-containing protein [Angustibacter aerolatus]